MPMRKEEAQRAASALDLQEEEMAPLQTIPMRGSLDAEGRPGQAHHAR
jgi:cyanate lyase